MKTLKEVILTKEDFEFVDLFCKENKISEGRKHIYSLYLFLNEYKLKQLENDKTNK